MADHKPGYVAVIVLTLLLFVGAVVLNFLSSWPIGKELGLFTNSPVEISDKYSLEITPAPWTFSVIWITIYVFQLAWLLYGLSTVCRRNSTWVSYLYVYPNFMPISIYLVFCLTIIANATWLFIFDREYLGISLGLVAFNAVSLFITIGLSFQALYNEGAVLLRMGHQREIGAVRGLVQNGMAFYATWVTIATHLALAIVMTYVAGLDQKDSSTIVLGMLGFFIIVYFLLDATVLDRYSRYLVTPYAVLIISLGGSLVNNWEWGERNSVITAILLGLSAFAFLFKLVIMIGRGRLDAEPISRGLK